MTDKKYKDTAERRQYIRLDTVFPIEFQIVGKDDRRPMSELREGFTRNVGKGGMGIYAKTLKEQDKEFFEFVPNETRLKLVINIPLDKEPVECYATVEWVEKQPGPFLDAYLFGVSYDFINEIEYEKILSYIKWLRLKPKLIFLSLALLVAAFISSSVFLFNVNKRRMESEMKLKETLIESIEARKIREKAEERVADAETTHEALEKKYMAMQAAFKKLAAEKQNLERRSKLREEDKKELQTQLEELAREKALLEEQIEKELTGVEEEIELETGEAETKEGAAKISVERLKAEEANYNKFRELILNEKIHSLSAYVSTHRSSIYHAAALFALAELRYKYGDRSLAQVTYGQVIEMYPRSKYALYASHRLDQLNRNHPYEAYTLKYYHNTYSLPELFDYREIEPYVK